LLDQVGQVPLGGGAGDTGRVGGFGGGQGGAGGAQGLVDGGERGCGVALGRDPGDGGWAGGAEEGVHVGLISRGRPAERVEGVVELAVGDEPFGEVGRAERFHQVADGAEFHRGADGRYVVVGGDHEGVGTGVALVLAELPQDVESAAVGQEDV